MQKRIALWDNLKLFLIFLVVVGHLTLQYFYKSQMFGTMSMVIYTFHMPAFIFVSGLFSKKSINADKPPIKKAFGFIVISFALRILNYISNIIFGVRSAFDIFSVKDIPWYMVAMAIWLMLCYCIRKIDTKYIFITSIVLGCFAGYMKGDTDFLCILRVITFFPFFYAGYVLDAKKIEGVTAKKGARIFSVIFFFGFVLICTLTFYQTNWLFPLLSARRKYSALGAYSDWGCLLRLAYYVVTALLVFSVISLCPRKELKISKGGQKTLQIYFYHRAILYIMKNAGLFYLIRLVGEGWEWIALLITVIITTVLCLDFWGKPLNYLIPKEKNNGAS